MLPGDDAQAGDAQRVINDGLEWLWQASDALFPSVYLGKLPSQFAPCLLPCKLTSQCAPCQQPRLNARVVRLASMPAWCTAPASCVDNGRRDGVRSTVLSRAGACVGVNMGVGVGVGVGVGAGVVWPS